MTESSPPQACAVLHVTPDGQQALGVWISELNDPLEPYYDPPDIIAEGRARSVIFAKGPAPTWAEWFAQLATYDPYEIWWTVIPVSLGVDPAEVLARRQPS